MSDARLNVDPEWPGPPTAYVTELPWDSPEAFFYLSAWKNRNAFEVEWPVGSFSKWVGIVERCTTYCKDGEIVMEVKLGFAEHPLR